MTKTCKSNKPRVTTRRLVWREVTLRVRHRRDYLTPGTDHIELIVIAPEGAPVPITDTGYRSHFIGAEELRRSGGPCAFFLAWIEREAKSKAWAKTEFEWRQLELFER